MFMNQDWNMYKDQNRNNVNVDFDSDLATIYRGPCMWAFKTGASAWAPINLQSPTTTIGEVGLLASDMYAPGM
jgi:hypothetical protein